MSHLFQATSLAQNYVRGRPTYDASIVEHILKRMKVTAKLKLAIDMGCGSGQFTQTLAPFVEKVIGLDSSHAQIECANSSNRQDHVSFQVNDGYEFPAEKKSVDLITVAQAYHWFDFDAFNKSVDEYLRPHGCLALIVYGMLQFTNDNANEFNTLANARFSKLIGFYRGENGTRCFADPRSTHCVELYANTPFIHYTDRERFDTAMNTVWDLETLRLYLKSWSWYGTYKEQCPDGSDVVDDFLAELVRLSECHHQTIEAYRIHFPTVVFTFIKPADN